MMIYDAMWYPDSHPWKFPDGGTSSFAHWQPDLEVRRMPMAYESDLGGGAPYEIDREKMRAKVKTLQYLHGAGPGSRLMLDIEDPLYTKLLSSHQYNRVKGIKLALNALHNVGDMASVSLYNVPPRGVHLTIFQFSTLLTTVEPLLRAFPFVTFSCYQLPHPSWNDTTIAQLKMIRGRMNVMGLRDKHLLAFVSCRVDRPMDQGGWHEVVRIPDMRNHLRAIADTPADGVVFWGPAYADMVHQHALGRELQRIRGRAVA